MAKFVSVLGCHVSEAVPFVVGALSVRITGMVCGLFADPEAVTVMAIL